MTAAGATEASLLVAMHCIHKRFRALIETQRSFPVCSHFSETTTHSTALHLLLSFHVDPLTPVPTLPRITTRHSFRSHCRTHATPPNPLDGACKRATAYQRNKQRKTYWPLRRCTSSGRLARRSSGSPSTYCFPLFVFAIAPGALSTRPPSSPTLRFSTLPTNSYPFRKLRRAHAKGEDKRPSLSICLSFSQAHSHIPIRMKRKHHIKILHLCCCGCHVTALLCAPLLFRCCCFVWVFIILSATTTSLFRVLAVSFPPSLLPDLVASSRIQYTHLT